MAAALDGRTTRGEYRLAFDDGHERWLWVSAGPLRGADGDAQGVVWVGHETTEERDRHEREARGEKLRALGQMASGVAHDLNQYLGLVAGLRVTWRRVPSRRQRRTSTPRARGTSKWWSTPRWTVPIR